MWATMLQRLLLAAIKVNKTPMLKTNNQLPNHAEANVKKEQNAFRTDREQWAFRVWNTGITIPLDNN